MLDENQIAAASRTLQQHWRAGTKLGNLDPLQRPRNRAEGYAIQAEIERASAGKLFGRSPRPARPGRSTSMSRGRWPDASCPRP
jgi:hypothetical protein